MFHHLFSLRIRKLYRTHLATLSLTLSTLESSRRETRSLYKRESAEAHNKLNEEKSK